jgi:hypothetical protein
MRELFTITIKEQRGNVTAIDARLFDLDLSADKSKLTIKINAKKFDITLAKDFRAAVDRTWVREIERVDLDFTSVGFIDSAGVGALVSVQKRLPPPARGQQGPDAASMPVAVINPSKEVLAILEVLRLHRVFRIVQS